MKNKKKIVLIIIIVLCLLIVFGSVTFLVLKNVNENKTNNEYRQIATSVGIDAAESLPSENVTESADSQISEMPTPDIDTDSNVSPVDFSSLTSQNSDIYSWIYIPGTNVNYPVCQSYIDDNYYLDHDVYGNYSFAGAIYSQVCNKRDFTDKVTVLYGHNMANGSMFATLHRFADNNFFESHDKIYIYTSNRKLTYRVVSAFVYDDRHIMNSFDFSKDDQFQSYLDTIQNPRSVSKNVRSNIDLSLNDKIITLSTCLNSGDGRYLVNGVLINNEAIER